MLQLDLFEYSTLFAKSKKVKGEGQYFNNICSLNY